MRFRVEHLGPLREAEVDLSKDLIVLTGPNNSGKTYLAWAVYGLLRFTPRATIQPIERLSEAFLASEDQSIALDDVAPYLRDYLADLTKAFTPAIHLCFASEGDRFRDVALSVELESSSLVKEWASAITSSFISGTASMAPCPRPSTSFCAS
ncbi:hypothetical protein ACSRUE_14060 [Sorangium sp. KYC3313]|uniref:hypothetical protein n=1 Tax=Sorangium sp. KYC3313 TaxID=3449740 RepID=UPI003F894328